MLFERHSSLGEPRATETPRPATISSVGCPVPDCLRRGQPLTAVSADDALAIARLGDILQQGNAQRNQQRCMLVDPVHLSRRRNVNASHSTTIHADIHRKYDQNHGGHPAKSAEVATKARGRVLTARRRFGRTRLSARRPPCAFLNRLPVNSWGRRRTLAFVGCPVPDCLRRGQPLTAVSADDALAIARSGDMSQQGNAQRNQQRCMLGATTAQLYPTSAELIKEQT